MMTNRKRMTIKPLSAAAILSCEKRNSTVDTNDSVATQSSATIVSPPVSEKKRILIQDSVLPVTPPIQRNKVLLSYSVDNNLTDNDSDSDDSIENDTSTEKSQKSNKQLYYTILMFSLWAAIQYWMITVAGFGAVFFIISALFAIYLNTTKSDKKSSVLSAYSVFNPQCKPIHGSADPKQLERELIFGGL